MHTTIARRLAAVLLACAPASCEVGAAPPGEPVVVYLDGGEATVLEPGQVTRPLDLCAALGIEPGALRYAEVIAPGETPIRVAEPLRTYPQRILAAFPVAGGIGVGWVDRVLGELPAELSGRPAVAFAPASEVRLRTLDVERAAAAQPKVPLRVAVAGVEIEYTPAELGQLSHDGPARQLGLPGGNQARAGTPVTSIVADALERAGQGALADVTWVVLRTAGDSLRLASEDLGLAGATGTRATAIKRNQKGLWRLKVWTREEDRLVPQEGLRGVERIEIELR
jgi:hypothetical protein